MDLPPCNFRVIVLDFPSEQGGNLYRSNAIDDGRMESASWLREIVGIKSYIDLREESEFHPSSTLDKYFVFKKATQIQENSYEPFNYGTRFHLPLYLLGDSSSISVTKYYYLMLDKCQDTMKKIFHLMLKKDNFPILISCSFGKDRTGIVAAIVMKLMGCSNEFTIKEYSKSENNLIPIKERLEKAVKKKNIDTEFCRSRPEFMEKFLSCLQSKYNGAEEYLKCCGITHEEIQTIRTNILDPVRNLVFK